MKARVILFFFVYTLLIYTSWAWISLQPRILSSNRKPPVCQSRDNDAQTVSLATILKDHGYNRRLVTIQSDDLPLLAEVCVNGELTFARIQSFRPPSIAADAEKDQLLFEPPVVVETVSDRIIHTIDFGQITTIWDVNGTGHSDLAINEVNHQARRFPSNKIERAFDRLYWSRVGRGRSGSPTSTANKGPLTKKQLSKLVQSLPSHDQPLYESVLRRAIKAGGGLSRLIDSTDARTSLYPKGEATAVQTAVAAKLLSADSSVGGRFKRWPCVYISSSCKSSSTDHDDTGEDVSVESVTILNGGWLVVDQSVRAGAEARKFVERSQEKSGPRVSTLADRRILRRLECLAMGELVSSKNHNQQESDLEQDARDALLHMSLPFTPNGAKKALIQVGHWSGEEDFSRIQPWTKPVLEATSWYAEKRLSMPQYYVDRIDLTNIPSLCVDATRTAFRDDAIGVRPRAGTGRKVDPEASKWEILVHITDVSDLYVSSDIDGKEHLECLKEAAKSRGVSRYDLPLGPLHLLPPRVLNSLSFSSNDAACHGAVTLWAYVDERNGKLLDVGVERTLISSPKQLSFEEATELMEQAGDKTEKSSDDAKARALLLVADRILGNWSKSYRRNSEAAQKRDARLSQRERESQEVDSLDNGRDGFQRTSGHRLVDSALDLYASGFSMLLKKAGAPVPESTGADYSTRGGRVATAPLRRYIDGEAQKQALAVLCGYGTPMSVAECRTAGKVANEARNSIINFRAVRKN